VWRKTTQGGSWEPNPASRKSEAAEGGRRRLPWESVGKEDRNLGGRGTANRKGGLELVFIHQK